MTLWCKINQLAALSSNDWIRLNRLFPGSTAKADASQSRTLEPSLSTASDSWDESWTAGDESWIADEKEKNENSSPVRSAPISFWLQNAKISVAPAHENLVVALKNAVAFFGLNPSNEIFLSGSAELPADATAIECIPIVANSKSIPKPYEWLCFVIGLADGSVFFYTETGTLLLKQKFARAAVKSFDLATIYLNAQELSILYEDSTLVFIDGLSLLTNLRVCRNQIASHFATVDQLSADLIEISFKVPFRLIEKLFLKLLFCLGGK